jgi:hypothetical protein
MNLVLLQQTRKEIDEMDVNNHFDAIVECCNFLKEVRHNDSVGKQDVIDSMEMRMHIIIKRVVANATFPYMPIHAWQIVDEHTVSSV